MSFIKNIVVNLFLHAFSAHLSDLQQEYRGNGGKKQTDFI